MSGPPIIALAVSVLLAVPLVAHHGSAAFETGRKVTLIGTVKQWVYSNPHLLLTLEVKGEDGTVVQWLAETQAPNVMYPAGYRKNTFSPGDAVTVIVEPTKDGRPIGRILQAVL